MIEEHARQEVLRGAKDGFPVLFAVAPYAMVLGAQASQVGISLAEITSMTGLNFAGGSEFAAIQLWSSPPPVLMIVLITFLINSRHIVMGAALAPYLQHLPKRKVVPALFFMADEGWAISYADTLRRSVKGNEVAFSWPYYWGVCLPFYPVWVGCSVLGAILGPALGDIDRYGFAMAFPAVFIVLLRGMWKGFRFARPWLVSLVAAATVYLLIPGAWFVLAGTLAGMLSAYLWAIDE
jgi:4-azaleucine resistance transporter AzlC